MSFDLECFSVARSALAELRKHQVDAVIWKNFSCLIDTPPDVFELDLYVPASSERKCRNILTALFFVEFKNTHVSFPCITHFYLPCRNGFVHFNIYFRLYTGESQTKLYDLTFLMNRYRSETFKGFSILDKKTARSLFLLRYFIKIGSSISMLRTFIDRDDYSKEYNFLFDSGGGGDLSRLNRLGFDLDNSLHVLKDGTIFRKLVESFRIKALLIPYARRGIFGAIVLRVSTSVARIFNKVVAKRRKKPVHSEGFIVSIVGSDGSGKSTLLDELHSWLAPFDVKLLAYGRLKKVSVQEVAIDSFKSNTSRLNERFIPALKSVVVSYLRFCIMRNAMKSRQKGYIVLIDRHPQEVAGLMDGPRISPSAIGVIGLMGRFERFMYRVSPVADIIVRLDVSLENAVLRNRTRVKIGKETDSEICDRYSEFQQTEYFPQNIVTVDANDSQEHVAIFVKRLIWSLL